MIWNISRRNVVNVTRIYFSPRSLSDLVDSARIVEACAVPVPLSDFSWNYSKDYPISTLAKRVDKHTFGDLECLMLSDPDRPVVSILKLDALGKDVFECCLVRPFSAHFDVEPGIYRDLSRHFSIHYGYSRHLRCDYNPGTETKVRKTLFGGSVKVTAFGSDWWLGPHDYGYRAIKGIYPLNFWTEVALDTTSSAGMTLPALRPIGDSLFFLDGPAQKQIMDANPGFTRFMHFGST